MDTTDPEIQFNESGHCNHCTTAIDIHKSRLPIAQLEKQLEAAVEKIKASGKNRPYDAIIGLSGGVDSSYAAYIAARRFGLRLLGVHLDNGWNSELAVVNIERLTRNLGIDLHTVVLNWDEFRDLQVAFLKASVPDAEIPTDHAIVAALYHTAASFKIRYLISGMNAATENILPRTWTHGIIDWKYIHAIHRQFGTRPLKTFPRLTLAKRFYYLVFRRMSSVAFLNYLDYNKAEAINVLKDEVDWTPYDGKHHESIYTKFFQCYILPRKFHIDKRKAHLSSLICSNQMTRKQALEKMAEELCPENQLQRDRDYVAKKLRLSVSEFEEIMAQPATSYRTFPNSDNLLYCLAPFVRAAQGLGLMPKRTWI